ncbi:hypothetical protein Tco_1418764 [Tanacetum coccineum]
MALGARGPSCLGNSSCSEVICDKFDASLLVLTSDLDHYYDEYHPTWGASTNAAMPLSPERMRWMSTTEKFFSLEILNHGTHTIAYDLYLTVLFEWTYNYYERDKLYGSCSEDDDQNGESKRPVGIFSVFLACKSAAKVAKIAAMLHKLLQTETIMGHLRLSKGAVDFLVKPIRTNELKKLWQHVWRKCHGVECTRCELTTTTPQSSGSGSGILDDKATKSRSIEESEDGSDNTDEDHDSSDEKSQNGRSLEKHATTVL